MNKQNVINIFRTIMNCSDNEMSKTCDMKNCYKCEHYISRNDMVDAMKYVVNIFSDEK